MRITLQPVVGVGAEAPRATEEKLRNSCAGVPEGGAAFALHEKRRGVRNGLKISQFQIHRRKRAIRTRALVEPPKIRFRAKPAAWNHGIVSVVQQVAQPRLPSAAFHREDYSRSPPHLGIQRPNLVANAQFAEAPEAVPHIATN